MVESALSSPLAMQHSLVLPILREQLTFHREIVNQLQHRNIVRAAAVDTLINASGGDLIVHTHNELEMPNGEVQFLS